MEFVSDGTCYATYLPHSVFREIVIIETPREDFGYSLNTKTWTDDAARGFSNVLMRKSNFDVATRNRTGAHHDAEKERFVLLRGT